MSTSLRFLAVRPQWESALLQSYSKRKGVEVKNGQERIQKCYHHLGAHYEELRRLKPSGMSIWEDVT